MRRIGVPVVVILSTLAFTSTGCGSAEDPISSFEPRVAGQQTAARPSRSNIEDKVRGLSREVIRLDRIESRQLRWNEFAAPAQPFLRSHRSPVAETTGFWAVAASGVIRP